MKSRQAYWSAKEYLMWEFLIGGRRNFKSSTESKAEASKLTFSSKFCNILETRWNSDQIEIEDGWWAKSRPPYLRAPSFGFGGTSDFPPFQIPTTPRNHFSPPMNQIYLHCLPQFAWGVHLTKCNPRYWSQKMPSGDICTPERGRPIPQSRNSPPNRLSQYHFSAFSQCAGNQ